MKRLLIIAALAVAGLGTVPAYAATMESPRLALDPRSRLWLNGNSTLHPYSSTSTLTEITATLSTDTVTLADVVRHAPFQTFLVVVPVEGLKSGEHGLDTNMYRALKADKYPAIRFSWTQYRLGTAATKDAQPFEAEGVLDIAGVQKAVTLSGSAAVQGDRLVVDGAYALVMSDYGIKPPTLLFGAIKVADPVAIHFHLLFSIQKGESQ